MSYSYIPENTYAVCTYQMGSEPSKFVQSRTPQPSVFHKELALLIISDKNLNKQFTCKSPVNITATILAFGVGLAVVASGPVGWLVAGAVLAGGAYMAVKAYMHKCTDPLASGDWLQYSPNVYFDKHNAIRQVSFLKCKSGGVLKPFFNYSLACAASKQISKNNLIEVGVNMTISFFAGAFLPATIMGIKTVGAGALFFGTNLVGLGITWTLQHKQRDLMRNDASLKDNEVYSQMNNHVDDNSWLPDPLFDDPSDPNDIQSLVFFQKAVKDGQIMVKNHEINQKFGKFSNMTTAQLKNSQEYRQILKDVNAGKYGPELKSSMQNLFKRMKPNKSSVVKGMNHTSKQFNNSFKQMTKNTSSGALFFFPFIGTYFSENARKAFAIAAAQDMGNGINIQTDTPLV